MCFACIVGPAGHNIFDMGSAEVFSGMLRKANPAFSLGTGEEGYGMVLTCGGGPAGLI